LAAQAKATERTFYPPLMDIVSKAGGESVSEVKFNSVPDIIFDLGGRRWILSVKIGETSKIIKEAFLQYLRHKEESGIVFGMLLLLPESVRKTKVTEKTLQAALAQNNVTALIDAGDVKEELRDRPFPNVIDYLIHVVLAKLAKQQSAYYSLPLVISLLQEQVTEMMEQINLEESKLLTIITDRKLLSDLGHLNRKHAEAVGRFLGSYIFLSQVLFLRLFAATNPDRISVRKPATHNNLRHAFGQISDINYRPIYKFDVLDTIDQKYLKDTFDLLWGLEIERVRHELPGRIFHELMPHEIRKMLASFYTRPHAADLLAQLTISKGTETLFDPACGSGTILTAGYKQKLNLWQKEGKAGNPHKRFCENEIFGSDIMPFAVHLTSANLSAMDAGTIIEKTQIIQGDSIRLKQSTYTPNVVNHLFPEMAKAQTTDEDYYDVDLKPVDTILMNPPFTKVERGIKRFVDMETFKPKCGGEVGLWGHFVMLADSFLKKKGIYGGVIPINILRGRESSKVRKFMFEKWTPLYILKPTLNYGFSESSEYRDILFIARKGNPAKDHQVKFGVVKKDLTKITDNEIRQIAQLVKEKDKLRNNELIDIDSFPIEQVKQRFENMMWFCGVTNFTARDKLVEFIYSFKDRLALLTKGSNYCRTGYRSDSGHSKFLFLTRETSPERVEKAFLRFEKEGSSQITASTPLGASYKIPKEDLLPSLRTPVGLQTMDITDCCDYIAKKRYPVVGKVCRAANITCPDSKFWGNLEQKVSSVETHLVVCRRINPFSPSQNLVGFFSSEYVTPSDQVNILIEHDVKIGKAICTILNSVLFFTQFFLLKEESTGRYVDIRVYDLEEMYLKPLDRLIKPLSAVFKKFSDIKFPCLREQFDENFDQRYEEFWSQQKGDKQERLFSVLDKPVKPFKDRLEFDLAVCKAIGLNVKKSDLIELYEIFVNEMTLIKGLKRD